MPTSLSLPDLPIGHVVRGDVVLRNVVVDTAPSTRVSAPYQPTQPATPLTSIDAGKMPKPRITPVAKSSPPQYSSDLRIPPNLSPEVFSVLIDKSDGSIVKADSKDVGALLQQDYYFIGAFDSATADAVIKDMIDNPIPTKSQVIDDYLNTAIPFATSAYVTGALMFYAMKNAQENWGNVVGFNDRVEQTLASPKTSTKVMVPKAYPKTATIQVGYVGDAPADSYKSFEGVSMPAPLATAMAMFRAYAQYELKSQFDLSKLALKSLPESMSFQVLAGSDPLLITNSQQEQAMEKYTDYLGQKFPYFVLALMAKSSDNREVVVPRAPINLISDANKVASQIKLTADVSPQTKEMTYKYIALNDAMTKMEESGTHLVATKATPLNREEIRQAYSQGLVEVKNAVNPNAGKPANSPSNILWVKIEMPDGRVMWTADHEFKRADCMSISRQLINGLSVEVCELPRNTIGAFLTQPSVPVPVAPVRVEYQLAPEYVAMQQQASNIGANLGVPANCSPNNPSVLPPAVVPPNCQPDIPPNCKPDKPPPEPPVVALDIMPPAYAYTFDSD